MIQIEVPAVGESVSSGILAAWFVADGDHVEQGQPLFELETDKATMSVPAPAGGVVKTTVPVDTEVTIGQVVGTIDPAAAPAAAPVVTAPPATPAPAPAQASPAITAADSAPSAAATAAQSPAVRRVLSETGVDPTTVTGTGKDGRLTKGDVLAATVKPSAPAANQERRKMSNLRKRIAENLVRSKTESAHLTTFNEVDMSAVMELRTRHKDAFEKRHKVRLGFMSFFLKAAQHALELYPAVNAFIDGTDVVYNHYCNIGVALSSDAGLIVPVVRNVENKGFAAIEAEIVDFITRAKEKRLSPDVFAGGTFTITNGGVFGSMLSTPIPNPGQTAILGMHSIQKRAVVVDDQIVIRPMMYLALTYDHRLIDGREAIGFLLAVKNSIEDPAALLLAL